MLCHQSSNDAARTTEAVSRHPETAASVLGDHSVEYEVGHILIHGVACYHAFESILDHGPVTPMVNGGYSTLRMLAKPAKWSELDRTLTLKCIEFII